MKFWLISGVKLSLDENEKQLSRKVTAILKISPDDILSLETIKKAIDARRNKPPQTGS